MAKQTETSPKVAPIPDGLIAVGNRVIVAPDGSRIQLGGEFTPEMREKLGDAKTRALMTAGHLQTQEQLDAADETRQRIADGQAANLARGINPNFGTPSMTPEALKAASGEPPEPGILEEGTGAVPGGASRGPVGSTKVADLNLDPRVARALQDGGLNTVDDVMRYGTDNDGLQTIEGIGEASERQIQTAIEDLED
jgi:hypothetical protein